MDDKPVGATHDPLAFVIGIWMVMAPFFLGFESPKSPETIVAWVAALFLFLSANNILVVPGVLDEYLDAAVGLGLLVSPWVLGYSHHSAATINAIAAAIVVLLCAGLALGRDRHWHWHVPGKHGPSH